MFGDRGVANYQNTPGTPHHTANCIKSNRKSKDEFTGFVDFVDKPHLSDRVTTFEKWFCWGNFCKNSVIDHSAEQARRLPTIFNWYIIGEHFAGVQLSGTIDSLVWVVVLFFPLGNPAWQATQCKDHGEHVRRNSNRPE